MNRQLLVIAALMIFSLSNRAEAKTFRASELSSTQWGEVFQGSQAATVEFREGDEIPVSFSAHGDFLETSRAGVSYVKVKRNFWLRLPAHGDLEASVDGTLFKPLKDVAAGSFEVGAGTTQPGVPINAINMVLTATAK